MPTYEFACRECERHHEVTISFHEDPPEKCPHCGGILRRVYTPVGVVFKGSGFYKTDSRLPRREPKSDGSGSSESNGSDSGSSGDTAKQTAGAASSD
ncbi:MAG: FmdB family transcriptional regulator [Acidimicrobiales bacterium]|nr:MAG: FmdB family transcriptional regulator [Acidimicrobiales bacterium]